MPMPTTRLTTTIVVSKADNFGSMESLGDMAASHLTRARRVYVAL
jgi:hypothetical protein